ncbi:hypothetical protein IQ07DRAFT_191865 [Pyrenochaeta sp. DS3sAY3a]|nr:hypothetical protein IQ07DRAFT_191865 [Pyrenochaeta sp. DS3sAY3a]
MALDGGLKRQAVYHLLHFFSFPAFQIRHCRTSIISHGLIFYVCLTTRARIGVGARFEAIVYIIMVVVVLDFSRGAFSTPTVYSRMGGGRAACIPIGTSSPCFCA